MSNIPVLVAPTPEDPRSVIYPTNPATGPISGHPTTPIPAASSTAVPSPTPTPGSTSSQYQQDARAYLDSLLREWGMESLSGWAWEQLQAGNSPTMITQLLYERPEFKARFPSYHARRAAGLTPLSVAEMLDYEKRAKQLFRASGLPLGFYDSNAELQDFMLKDVSLTELSARIQLATEDYFSLDPIRHQELQRLYGLTPGQRLAYILDETKALPLIERQWLSASLAAEATRTTFGQLTVAEAEALAGLGITTEAAQKGFSALAAARGLFASLPGEVDPSISRGEQIAAAFYGDAGAQERIRRREQARVAEYEEGGGFSTSTGGITGLGSSRN